MYQVTTFNDYSVASALILTLPQTGNVQWSWTLSIQIIPDASAGQRHPVIMVRVSADAQPGSSSRDKKRV